MVAHHEDFDLVLGVPQASDDLLDDPETDVGIGLRNLVERGVVEGERERLIERDGGALAVRALEQRELAEQVTGSNDAQASLDRTDLLEQADPSALEQEDHVRRVTLPEHDGTR